MHRTQTNPSTFLADLDDPRSSDLEVLDALIVRSMPGRSRTLWEGVFWGGTEQSIIGYGDLVQRRPKGDDVEWFVVGLALQQKHISLYVNAVEDNKYLGSFYGPKLGRGAKVKVGAASIGFRSVDLIDLDVCAELIGHAHSISPPDESAPTVEP